MTDQENRSGGGRGSMALLWATIALVVVLLLPLRRSDVLVEVYGFEIAVWILAIAFYFVGIVAGWASFKARQG